MKGALPADFPAHGGLVPFTLGLALMSAAGLSAVGPMALKNIAILRPLRASEDLALSAQVEGGAVRVADGAGQAWMTADIAKRHDWASRSADQGLAGPRRTSGPAAALAACLLESAKTQGREGLPTAAEGFTPGDPGAGPWGLSLSEGGLALMLGDAAIGALDGLQLFEDRIALVRPEWEDIGFLPPDDLAATLKGAFARLPREESAAQNSALARGLTQAAADFAERALTAAAKNGRDHRGLARLREIAGQGRATDRRAEDILEKLREDHAAHADEIALLGRCGAGWEKLLSGEADSALQFLVDPTDEDLLLRVYRDGPASLRANALTAAALSALIDARGDEHPLTLLEIGAGTGATTAHLLPLLPAGSRYIASDLAAGLLSALAKRHGGQNALETRLIDITRPLAEQGIAPSSIDIVVAANVLHAIEDPARALAGLLESLAPGAQLILQELTCRAPWLDLVFGLTDGWWAAQRDDGPLLRREGWHALFEDAGFSPVADAATAPPEVPGSQSVFVAQSARVEPLLRDQTHHLSEDGPHLQKAETAARLLLPDDAGARALARARASEARGAARAYVSISTGDAAAPLQRFPACADPQLRVEGRRIKAFRLRHGLASVAWPKGAQVLILGGTGGIGRALACALKSKAARRIILASRSAGDDALTELGSGDGPCMIEACRLDLEDKEAARATITALLAEGVTHIVHAAGNDGANAPFEAALALARGAKVGGTEAALAALESHPDAAFVLLSSAAATLGLPGAAAYAMANAEAEARVWEARAKGQAASFIALGPVRDAGMANTANAASWARFGIGLLAQDEAMRGVAAALDNAQAFAPALIAEIDWRKARPFLAYGQDAPHLAPLLKSAAPAPVPTPPPPPSPDAPEAEISKAPTRQIVTQTLAAVLGIGEARRIDPDRGLNELGLDSLTAVELANRLSRQTGLSLAPTAAFDYPTVNALAAHIAAQAGDDGAGDAAETGVPEPSRQSAPGSARLSLDELHALSDEEAWEKLVLEGG
ncbi:MAG: SDR family NAD(P)-dependent oxidoreductase [Pseudomonadota bacterium]